MRFISKLVLCALLASPATASSSALSRIGKTVKATGVAIAFATTVMLNSAIAVEYKPFSIKELSVGFDLDKKLLVGGAAVLVQPLGIYRNVYGDVGGRWFGLGYLDGVALVNESVRFSRLKAALAYKFGGDVNDFFYDTGTVYADIYYDGGFSTLGYERLDLRVHDTQGFTVKHPHLLGFNVTGGDRRSAMLTIKSSFGVNDIGIGNVGSFDQADLQAWAGKDADISYVLFHEGGLLMTFIHYDEYGTYQAGDWTIALELRDLRTIYGDIDFKDGTDGNFSATWKDITLSVSQEIPRNEGMYIQGKARIYQQTINADGRGNSFSMDKKGTRVTAKIKMLFDS